MDIDTLIDTVDHWVAARQQHGYRAGVAHRHPDDNGAGRTALAAEHHADNLRMTWANALADRADSAGVSSRDLRRAIADVDQYGFVAWLAGWEGQLTSLPADSHVDAWAAMSAILRLWSAADSTQARD